MGGIIIGVAQKDLSFAQASQNYTMLTVGDGLVTQIPALIVSTAAGMLAAKAGMVGSTDKALFGQLGGYPSALGLSAFLMIALSLLPGIPMIPFMFLGAVAGSLAYLSMRKKSQREAEILAGEQAAAELLPVAEEPIGTALQMDYVRLELGYGLLPLINNEGGQRLTDQIKALRRQLAGEMGFVLPSVRIQDNMQLPANTYVVRTKEIESGRGDLRPNMLLVMDPKGETIQLPGEETVEPTFGLPAMWVEDGLREEASFKGYTVVDPATVVTTHITEIVKDNMAELLSYAETQKLLDELDSDQQKLITDMIPNQISVTGVQRILQNLLSEGISIRDLPTILEGVSEACTFTGSIGAITEHVRTRLSRQISDTASGGSGYIPLVALSPEWEQAFVESIVGDGEDKQLSLAPSRLQEFIGEVRDHFERQAMLGENPVLLTGPQIRPFVRSIVERFRPMTMVMSQNEVHAKAKIKTLGQI